MSRARYRIDDEPVPGALQDWVVNPFWPLLGLMLGGVWLGWPWFVFNGVAMGSAYRRKEWLTVAAALAALLTVIVSLLGLASQGVLPEWAQPYMPIPLVLVKLAAGYVLYSLQATSFELFEHFGGKARNGVLVLIAGAVAAPAVEAVLPPFLRLVLR